jgi:hypothetical protein
MRTVRTATELGKAIKEKEDYIYIEGDLKNKVVRIKAVGTTAWILAGGSLATAIALYLATPATTVVSAPVGGIVGAIPFTGATTAAAAAITILGLPAVTVAITIGMAAGGYGAITAMRDKYSIESKSDNGIILKKK